MSAISPNGINAAISSSFVASGGNEDTWIVHFMRCCAVAAISRPRRRRRSRNERTCQFLEIPGIAVRLRSKFDSPGSRAVVRTSPPPLAVLFVCARGRRSIAGHPSPCSPQSASPQPVAPSQSPSDPYRPLSPLNLLYTTELTPRHWPSPSSDAATPPPHQREPNRPSQSTPSKEPTPQPSTPRQAATTPLSATLKKPSTQSASVSTRMPNSPARSSTPPSRTGKSRISCSY